MALTVHGNGVAELDTVDDEWTGSHQVQRIDWNNPTNATHTLVISDSKDNLILRAIAGETGVTLSFNMHHKIFRGIKIGAIGSGTVTIQTS